jgi:uncharacterized protein YqeY
MLFDDLNKAKMMALKNKDASARSVLEAVISRSMLQAVELKAKGLELTDKDTLANIQKVCKELEEEKTSFAQAGRQDNVDELDRQITYISQFLPKQLSEDEIKKIILSLDDKSLPNIMKHFKANYQGQCDMGVVSRVAKSL